MGKPTGFLDYNRVTGPAASPESRIRDFAEFHTRLPQEEQERQGARCMECGVPFCQSGMMIKGMVSGCPLNNLIPEWNDLISTHNWKQAYDRLQKTNCFPEFTARVCPALCEKACTCGLNGDPVSSRENEWSIIENAFTEGFVQPQVPQVRTGKKVAVIGSGPAGLAAASQLNRRGHSVTVFERADRAGGLLMYGIPNMKLDKGIVERRLALMRAEGVRFETGVDIGRDRGAEEILREFDGVVLACGASKPRDIAVPGREGKGIYFAVDFLRATTKSLLDSGLQDGRYISAEGKKVVVIGGGDTGNDCVGTAIRHGCADVVQLEMMPKLPDERAEDNPWPEWPRVCKTDYGQEEAIAVFGRDPRLYQTTVREFVLDEEGKLCRMVLVRLAPVRDEASGRMRMEEVPGSEYEIEADLCLIAAGFLGSEDYVTEAFGVETDARGNVAAGQYRTSAERVFAAGDMRRGQSLVVWAIREGREAAREVDRFLMGYTNL